MANNLLSVWSTIGSVALAILILLVMITIHEFGHYLVGKLLRFKIDEFSIGFGPALFKRRSKKTGELFAVRLLPLGGFCAFAGEDGDEEEGKKKKKSAPENEPFEELENAEAPAEEKAETETVGESEPSPAENKPPKKRDWNDDGLFTHMKPWKRILVLFAGAAMNYLLALVLIIVAFLAYGQSMVAVYKMEEAEGEYAVYSLHDLDILLRVEGKELYLVSDVAQALNQRGEGDLVKILVSRVVGEEWVDDGKGGTVRKYLREEMEVTVMLRAKVDVKNSADFSSLWNALGVKYEESEEEGGGGYYLANAVYSFGFWKSLGRAFVYSFKIAGSIFKVIGELFMGRLGLSAFGGPVTTIRMTSEIASRGFRYFLEIAGYIGVNLAVFNLLPIPALDGSKVVFTAIEWVRGRPISRKIEAIIHAVGFVLLLGFAILVDILQFVL